MMGLKMSYLLWIYTVHPLIFELLILCTHSLDNTFFFNFADLFKFCRCKFYLFFSALRDKIGGSMDENEFNTTFNSNLVIFEIMVK